MPESRHSRSRPSVAWQHIDKIAMRSGVGTESSPDVSCCLEGVYETIGPASIGEWLERIGRSQEFGKFFATTR
jgi:hypothetical protein